MKHLLLLVGVITCLLPAARAQQPGKSSQALPLTGQFWGTHDPSIIKQGGDWYVFATGAAVRPDESSHSPVLSAASLPQLPVRCSSDLHDWRRCGAVFPGGIPAWIQQASPGTKELWAPDISLYAGSYHLYYAYSLFGRNTSGIALATARTLDPSSPDAGWVDQGLVLESKAGDNFNAIDPNLVLDEKGDAWLAFGSFWSGIKMRRVDPTSGKLSTRDRKTYALATRARPKRSSDARADLPPDWQAVEAPFVLHHDDYYYLFVSWDLCCRGIHSTYHAVVGRSHSVHGPYVDRQGRKMSKGGGTPVLSATSRWVGPGGQSALHTEAGDIMVFHAYDAQTGRPALQISTIEWSDGWPTVAVEGDPR